jgi:hypothetical protein
MKPYEYVNQTYGTAFEPGQRVKMIGSGMVGTVARKRNYDHYVHVVFDGRKFDVPCHPADLLVFLDPKESA